MWNQSRKWWCFVANDKHRWKKRWKKRWKNDAPWIISENNKNYQNNTKPNNNNRLLTMNEYSLQNFPCFDDKWIRADLDTSLRSAEHVSILWNTLIKDVELITLKRRTAINANGHTAFMAANGKYYCGIEKLECNCNKNCAGICHPRSHCNCKPCRTTMKIGADAEVATATSNTTDGTTKSAGDTGWIVGNATGGDIVESWLWCNAPSE